ncbi:MarR family winged helix-turn-helix transcriptional regulator [Methanobrevibacter sp.]|uniref:MarR family winged helix-turn-helix transcriptional regulator n=1 Tax=Methanobrevibacter sp. TaxID=66852 RepID=UPI0025EA5813|nr:MarR family transcriptional regulator [Methanobrevibacter sp.]MBR4447953.1 MarR family transcriptional regulator [Methanobrevibacter sp.]
MSVEELDASCIPIAKLITIIARGQTTYLNHELKDLDINSTQLHLLFEISNRNDLNQEMISSGCSIDKGAVARSVKKLEEKGLVSRKVDEDNRRQNKISLTQKGRKTLDESIGLLNKFEEELIDESIIEKELLQKALKEIAIRTMELNQNIKFK